MSASDQFIDDVSTFDPTERSLDGYTATGHGPSGAEEFGQPKHAGDAWDEPDWTIVDDRRGQLREFPTDVFSGLCKRWLESAAHGAGVTPAHVAVPLLGIAAGLVGTARRVRATQSWSEPLTLWTAVIGLSGSGKTPGIDVTKNALSLYREAAGRQNCRSEARPRAEDRCRQSRAEEVAGRGSIGNR